MIYTTEITQTGSLYAVKLIASDGLVIDIGAAPSIAAARRMARMAIAATSNRVTVQPINF